VRLAIYSDYSYRRSGDELWAELSVVVFLAGLARWLDAVTLVGRLEPEAGEWAYRVPSEVSFAALPHYPSLARPGQAARALVSSLRRFWRVLDDVDCVWLLGPHPFAVVFALLAWCRGRRVALGVRQDLPAYVCNRHPGRRSLRLAALALEGAWRLLARACPVVVVGPDLARRYRCARRLLAVSISLVGEGQIAGPEALEARAYDGELRVLSVGRLEPEKNPLLLADILGELASGNGRWRLLVCGEGPMGADLEARLERLGVADGADLLGFVSLEGGLTELYRSSHLLLHCSWTEGVPQVLLEASAARLPMVATAVGGVPEAAGGAALLVPPGDAAAAAAALRELTDAAAERAREHSLDAETRRVARFLIGDGAQGDGGRRTSRVGRRRR
jgi:glycosyltransferase involved in cell wall biosynthesis